MRALLLALALQVLAPLFGGLPAAQAAPEGALTVCTAHGLVTLVPDGQGGWTEQAPAAEAGLACAFCLPLLSGHAGPIAALVLPEPAATVALPAPTAQAFARPAPSASAARPRAPPVLA